MIRLFSFRAQFGYAFSGGPGTGILDLAQNQSNNYFCIDGGQTPLKLYNNHSNGEDDKDWASGSNDAFNAFSSSGVVNSMSALDIEEMNVIGYQVPLPEPASVGIASIACAALTRRQKGVGRCNPRNLSTNAARTERNHS